MTAPARRNVRAVYDEEAANAWAVAATACLFLGILSFGIAGGLWLWSFSDTGERLPPGWSSVAALAGVVMGAACRLSVRAWNDAVDGPFAEDPPAEHRDPQRPATWPTVFMAAADLDVDEDGAP